MKKNLVLISCVILGLFGLWQIKPIVFPAFAEISGGSPDSGATSSRIKTSYDWLVAKGANYGATDAADWDSAVTYPWGTYWNRIMESAAWEPEGSASADLVPIGYTFYAGNGDRTIKTGTLFQNWELQDYDDWNCSANNAEATGACAAGDSEYTGEEGTWTLTATGGTAQSVTDNSVTVTLASNKVYKDARSGLYWTDANAGGNIIDNEFVYIDGNDRANPAGNSCNFNSAGTANPYCDNQDPLSAYTEDNDVSAADFCLNLQVDGDNADADSNGATGMETNWRLPTQKELMQAYINGAANNLPNPGNYFWSSTESYNSQSNAWYVYLPNGYTTPNTKATLYAVRCVRRD